MRGIWTQPILALAASCAAATLASCSGGITTHPTPPAARVLPTTTVAPSTTTTGRDTTTTTSPQAAAARASLDAYLAALAALDTKAALDHSEGAAAALGGIRTLIAQIDTASGIATTTQLTGASFDPQSIGALAVVFGGNATLSTNVRGPSSTQRTVSSVTGPVTVVLVNGVWRVKDFMYDGAPMVYEAELAQDQLGATQLHVVWVLSYANFTSAVVGLTGNTSGLALANATLTTSAGTRASTGSGFTTVAEPAGFVAFARNDAVPTRLTASFRRTDGSTLAFSVPLSATPG